MQNKMEKVLISSTPSRLEQASITVIQMTLWFFWFAFWSLNVTFVFQGQGQDIWKHIMYNASLHLLLKWSSGDKRELRVTPIMLIWQNMYSNIYPWILEVGYKVANLQNCDLNSMFYPCGLFRLRNQVFAARGYLTSATTRNLEWSESVHNFKKTFLHLQFLLRN